jgi:protease-4
MNTGNRSNEPGPRGPIARFFKGLWDAVDFARRLVFNLVFVALVLVVVGIFMAGDTARPLLDRTTLVIAPQGRLVEQYSSDRTSRALARMFGDDSAREVQLRDVLRALEAAKDDKRIERVLLRTDRMAFSGYASIREVAGALAALRASGKQVVAFGEAFDQKQYLLAAQSDQL